MSASLIALPDAAGLARASALLREGSLVGLPTETVYGLAANALDPAAVAKIFEAKGRPFFDPLIVHLPGLAEAEALVTGEWPAQARKLAELFWPGPLTLILPKHPSIPDLVTSGLPYVALRAPSHPVAQAVLKAAGLPLAAPSANRFGRISPTTAEAVAEELGGAAALALILDGGPCPIGLESTILAFPEGESRPLLLRAGGLSVEEIEHAVGPLAHNTRLGKEAPPAGAAAPGQLPSHYAPRTPLRRIGHPSEVAPGDRNATALLAFGPLDAGDAASFQAVENLSPSASLPEAAARLFTLLRTLDHAAAREIVALPVPETGLGLAINDRLIRAAHQ
ncbi:translation factor SUA5 [Verrucomicrobium sp. GAS474]|uniref:L-threonylcarbamoyladenylate synthase n=1 Tax=Verrucomicrobium sp. GAS474 TaxID=1882831 RepID=UPI00087AD5E1|nr:L-threonylcarbamoyladenylate synthase [Verrucomicrobium sp. GAS474]SDT87776.1 translation factor SUA5 [Verrucomicrobium sp. GAS474]